jgi:hypothetical protein
MKRISVVLLVLLVVAALPVAASGQGEKHEEAGALAIAIDGPDQWEPGNLDRLLIELTPVTGNGESYRASLPLGERIVVLEDVKAGAYAVTRARYGLPDGRLVADVDTPEEQIVITAGELSLAPFSLEAQGAGPTTVTWSEVSSEIRVASTEETLEIVQ